MSGADEEWVKAAMTDDAMVVELLVRLHHAPPPPPPPHLKSAAALSLEWSVRQRRSKSVSVNTAKKLGHRGSPTTPLSWSAATSFSGGSAGAGSEEFSRPVLLKLSDTTRSKVIVDTEKTTSKRSRKKKTLAELKDEENVLLKERRELKKEMTALRMSLERQRATNENLKRMKIELQPRLDRESTSAPEVSISGQVRSCNDVINSSTSNACPEEKADAPSDTRFIVPDLNIPFDEPSSDVICGIS